MTLEHTIARALLTCDPQESGVQAKAERIAAAVRAQQSQAVRDAQDTYRPCGCPINETHSVDTCGLGGKEARERNAQYEEYEREVKTRFRRHQ